MASNSVNTGDAGQLVIVADVVGSDAWGNRTQVSWSAYFNERVPYNYTHGSATATVYTPGGVLYSGRFNFDWRAGGQQSTLIASGTDWWPNRPNGTGENIFAVQMGSTGTAGGGGPATVDVLVTYPYLLVPPGQPHNIVATRVSDGQVNLNWAQASQSNGEAWSNIVWQRRNNGPSEKILDINATTGVSIGVAYNQKLQYEVEAWNPTGYVKGVGPSNIVYTTPAAPSNVTATKGASLDIAVSFKSNVAYSEHEHQVEHGVVTGGNTVWDGTVLATLASGRTSYTHTAPDASKVHVYRVRAKAGALTSPYAASNSVQLLVAPNKPTVQALPQFADRAAALTYSWVHNPVDTTPQKAYEFAHSINGGTSWVSSGKVVSTGSSRVIPANTFGANVVVSTRVRTWGSATTGGSDGTGASPWSNVDSIQFKTVPNVTSITPANGSVVNEAVLRVTVGFSQAEGASFVKANVVLKKGAVELESLDSNILTGITMATPVDNGGTYTLSVRVQDSNGLWSAPRTSTFTVAYLAPPPVTVAVSYLPETGYGQIKVDIPPPAAGQSAASLVTITRKIDGVEELIVQDYPAAAEISFLDTTPTIHGTNVYTVTTTSALGAQTTTTATLKTSECRRAYLSKGNGFEIVVVFGANLSVSESLNVASTSVEAAGRSKPIGLYGMETSVSLKVSSFVFDGFGSSVEELRRFLLMPGKTCYRDASGRRVFGTLKGSLAYKRTDRADLQFTINETS